MKKTYNTKYTQYGIYVKRGDKLEHVRFVKKLVPNAIVGSTFTTEDTELQQALEAHKSFGLLFWTNDKEPAVEPNINDETDTPKVEKKVKRYSPKK